VYVGFVWPCHPHCGTVHTALMLTHFLTLCMVGTTACVKGAHLFVLEWRPVVLLASVTAVATSFLRPLVNFPFDATRRHDERTLHFPPRPVPPASQDLVEFGARKAKNTIGVSGAAMARLRGIASDWHAAMPTPPSTSHTVDDASIVAQLAADDLSAPNTDSHDPLRTVTQLAPFRRAGFALCAVLSAVFFLVAYWNTQPWCPPQFHAFGVVLAVAVGIDAVVVQPLCLALTALWAWMVAEDDEPPRFHLHPIHGQPIYVGVPVNEGNIFAPGGEDEDPRALPAEQSATEEVSAEDYSDEVATPDAVTPSPLQFRKATPPQFGDDAVAPGSPEAVSMADVCFDDGDDEAAMRMVVRFNSSLRSPHAGALRPGTIPRRESPEALPPRQAPPGLHGAYDEEEPDDPAPAKAATVAPPPPRRGGAAALPPVAQQKQFAFFGADIDLDVESDDEGGASPPFPPVEPEGDKEFDEWDL